MCSNIKYQNQDRWCGLHWHLGLDNISLSSSLRYMVGAKATTVIALLLQYHAALVCCLFEDTGNYVIGF